MCRKIILTLIIVGIAVNNIRYRFDWISLKSFLTASLLNCENGTGKDNVESISKTKVSSLCSRIKNTW